MKLGNEIHKTSIVRGASVTVKGREGRILDARPGQAKIEFRIWFVRWTKWIPIGDVDLSG